ncbi:MAG: NAD(+)/NADH kinase [Oscillospiraceae bacterium]|nr:NAD(+)/NADH kinase [Oscillospiraceae bacterium]
MSNEKNIILYSNAKSDVDFKTAKQVADMLSSKGRRAVLCPYPDDPDFTGTEMIITFGGDGTILHAARAAAKKGVPILGVNLGSKGFMAELEPGDIGLIEKIVMSGGSTPYVTEARMMLDIEVLREGKQIYKDYALNDVVVRGDNKVVEMTVFANDQKITHFSGDGTVIATPTGSTAYSMSAGGPIVEPTAKNIIITPICAHSLEAKTFVLTANNIITVKIDPKKANPVYVSVDGGGHLSVQREDTVKVTKSASPAQFVKLSDKSFYHRIWAKLSCARLQ